MNSLTYSVTPDGAAAEFPSVASLTRLGVLAATIAHEVNQPLTGIINNASTCLRMLAADPPNVAGALETAQRTIRDGNRATNVIKGLRSLFSMKDATTELVDLNDAAREALDFLSADLESYRIFVRLELAESLPPVSADRTQLQQVILNLIRNAADAMSSVNDRPRQLTIKTERTQRGSVCLSVQDVGVGIDIQRTERLFAPFYTTKVAGMGVGLSLSRAIVESHHGRLWAASNDGPGTTFSFSIPCKADNIAANQGICIAGAAAKDV